jgi:hypothetical protein
MERAPMSALERVEAILEIELIVDGGKVKWKNQLY